jgi:hypothetical protein
MAASFFGGLNRIEEYFDVQESNARIVRGQHDRPSDGGQRA